MNKIPKQCIIIGSGSSIRQGLWNTPIEYLPLWQAVKNKFTITINWSYLWHRPTVAMYGDYRFYALEKEGLDKLPLVIGKKDGFYDREEGILGKNVYLLKGCKGRKVDLNNPDSELRDWYWGKDSWKEGFYCYDKETEVLTDKGWKYFKDLDRSEKVATLNPQTNEVEYHLPNKYICEKYIGCLIQEKSKRIDLLVTPEHNMYCKTTHHKNLKNYKFIKAKDLKNIQYRKDFPYKGKNEKYFILPAILGKYGVSSKKILMNDWLEFLGWYISEGSCYADNNSTYKIIISQSEKSNPQHCQEIEENILKCGFHYYKAKTKTCTNYTICNKQLFNYLKQLGKAKEKYIPRQFLELDKKYLKCLFNSLIKGDGTISKGICTYTTSSKQLMNDIYELGLKLGYSPNTYLSTGGYTQSKCFKINFSKTHSAYVKNRIRNKIYYNGNVYCVNVQNNIIYVRRNGKSCWSGNSPQLTGIMALTFAIQIGCKEIFLLGMDWGEINGHTHFYDDTNVGKIVWQGQKQTGVGRNAIGNYNTGRYDILRKVPTKHKIVEVKQNRPEYWYDVFKKESVKIYNVSPKSNIESFEKIDFDVFYKKMEPRFPVVIQSEVRKEIRRIIHENA